MSGNPLRHWKKKPSGVVPTFDYQDESADYVIILQVAGPWDGYKSVHIPKRCMDCGTQHPREGYAPVFNQNPVAGAELPVLLCNSCYDRRCVQEQQAERERWLEADRRRTEQNREASRRYREKLKQQRKAG